MTVHSFNGHDATTNQQLSLLQEFMNLFNTIQAKRIGPLDAVYHPDVKFQDPFVTIQTRPELARYLEAAYHNVLSCRFQFGDPVLSGNAAYLPWLMTVCHKRLRGGDPIVVEGVSYLRDCDGRIIWHRDYFDAGQLVYENIPVLGAVVRWLRRHAG
ncbi:nuclear transport factor 2 family protein [Marinobacter sp. SS21]|uniref:nuclear transport factor 2 family protein n=1 Tax=Marinobacter sp. SS21 TaxID=2979460 RepID=UPI00233069D7|nr:nuclear transport factor 2 family protein [Marinobacter sp. SS21]MDC0661813.1 nuclear transport factor 2 family protein [Marinobacter sp. SS21]